MWYWFNHDMIPQNAVYLCLSKQLPLIHDIVDLIVTHIKQLLSPWILLHQSAIIEYLYKNIVRMLIMIHRFIWFNLTR